MIAAILQEAIRSLGTLPAEVQDELGTWLFDYVARWQELKAGIDQATAEFERGKGIETTDREAILDKLAGDHGRSQAAPDLTVGLP